MANALKSILALGVKAEVKTGSFYKTIGQVTGKCHYIKPSSNPEYTNSFSGLVDIIDEDGVVHKDNWFNFAPNQIDEDTPINVQLIGSKRLPVIVEELEVASTATPEDLVKYGKKVGDRVARISFL